MIKNAGYELQDLQEENLQVKLQDIQEEDLQETIDGSFDPAVPITIRFVYRGSKLIAIERV